MKSPSRTVSQLWMTCMSDSTVDDAAIVSILLPILANASFNLFWALLFFNNLVAQQEECWLLLQSVQNQVLPLLTWEFQIFLQSPKNTRYWTCFHQCNPCDHHPCAFCHLRTDDYQVCFRDNFQNNHTLPLLSSICTNDPSSKHWVDLENTHRAQLQRLCHDSLKNHHAHLKGQWKWVRNQLSYINQQLTWSNIWDK